MSLYKAFTASENTKDNTCRYDWRTTSLTLLPYGIIYMKRWSLNALPVQCKSILPKALKTNPLLLIEAVLKEVSWRKDQYLLACVCKPTLMVYENKNYFHWEGGIDAGYHWTSSSSVTLHGIRVGNESHSVVFVRASKSLTTLLNLPSARFSVSAGGPKAKNVLLILGGVETLHQ